MRLGNIYYHLQLWNVKTTGLMQTGVFCVTKMIFAFLNEYVDLSSGEKNKTSVPVLQTSEIRLNIINYININENRKINHPIK